MALARIKQEFLNKRVAFGKSAAPLYKRDDIDDLAIMALESKNPELLQMFEELPELSVLKKAKTDAELKALSPDTSVSKEDPNQENKKTIDIEQNLTEDPNAENKKSNPQ